MMYPRETARLRHLRGLADVATPNAVAATAVSGVLGGVIGFALGGVVATGLWLWYYESGKRR